jgi:hypothetical protein
MGAILGIIVLGLVYALFTFGINKGAETFNSWSNSKNNDSIPTKEEKRVIESFIEKGYVFFLKDKNGIYLQDKERILYLLTKSEGGWVLKFIRTSLTEEELEAVNSFEEKGYISLIKDKSDIYLRDKENVTYLLVKSEEKWILKPKYATFTEEQKVFLAKWTS